MPAHRQAQVSLHENMRAKEGGKETAFFFLLRMVSCGSSPRFAPASVRQRSA